MSSALERGGAGLRGEGARQAVSHLKAEIASGKHWYLALLEAIGLWDLEEEFHGERHFCYLIGGEAFDWFLLAERLLAEVDGSVPQEEVEALLFCGQPPMEVEEAELRRLMGYAKHRAYLNYLYGITVEEALILAVEQEVRKERRCRAAKEDLDLEEEAYNRIYGQPYSQLLEEFCRQKGCPLGDGISFSRLKEFTYWLFKYRLEHSHKARLASDTKKGLEELRRQRQWGWPHRLMRLAPSSRPDGVGS